MKAQQKSRMLSLVKMFFAMGISWLAEFLSWVLGWYFGRAGWVVKVSFFFDVINASQGIILFLVLFFDTATVDKCRGFLNRKLSKTNSDRTDVGEKFQDNYRIRHGSTVSDSEPANTTTEQVDDKQSTTSPIKMVVSALASPLKKRRDSYEVTPIERLEMKPGLQRGAQFLEVPEIKYGR